MSADLTIEVELNAPALVELAQLREPHAAVRAMREHQRDWFGGDKSPAKLRESKAAERKVDQLLVKLGGQAQQGRLL